ncbi:hypothetical protein ANN_27830 [Periplaneta americana]|uniref:Uncharacterized protein n=1 Tax=Periplaneta americana TaxID=6978 RepID=A0ABQ8RV92_PERAM|nr:hypothetical protein ANN_27830 [Periplaneta americana]
MVRHRVLPGEKRSDHCPTPYQNKNNSTEDLKRYAEARRNYKALLRKKKTPFWEEEGKQMVQDAIQNPYIALRKKKTHATHYIPMEEWENHFKNILNRKGKEEAFAEITETPDPWIPFSTQEVAECLNALKNKKAAGLDHLFTEHLKQACHLLNATWTQLFNKCIEIGDIPEKWKESTIKVIHKGKGEPTNTNNYRGIALECNPFKALSKLVYNRIRDEIEKKYTGRTVRLQSWTSC